MHPNDRPPPLHVVDDLYDLLEQLGDAASVLQQLRTSGDVALGHLQLLERQAEHLGVVRAQIRRVMDETLLLRHR